MYHIKNEHCSYCGALFLNKKFPQKCLICTNITYLNPLPVSVVIVPVYHDESCQNGILIVRRGIEPKLGEWALPGGFIELGESWQEGSIREIKEETSLDLDINKISLLEIKNSDNGNMLIFSTYSEAIYWNNIKFTPNREVTEIKVSHGEIDLAFPTHDAIVKKMLPD